VADSPLAVVAQHLYAEPPPLRPVRPDLPPALERLVLRLLAKDPDRRPADATEVYHALLPHVTEPALDGELGPTRPYHYPLGPLPMLVEPPAELPARHRSGSAEGAVRALDEQRDRAVSLVDEGRITQAGQVLAAATRAAGDALGTGHPDVVDARLALAHVYLLGGDHRRALPELQHLLPDLTSHYGEDHDFVWDAKRSITACYAALGQHTQAVTNLRTLLTERRRARGPDDPELAELVVLLDRLGGDGSAGGGAV
jgi:hypothetical protein